MNTIKTYITIPIKKLLEGDIYFKDKEPYFKNIKYDGKPVEVPEFKVGETEAEFGDRKKAEIQVKIYENLLINEYLKGTRK